VDSERLRKMRGCRVSSEAVQVWQPSIYNAAQKVLRGNFYCLGCGNPLKCPKLGRLKRLTQVERLPKKKLERVDFLGHYLRIFLSMRFFA